MACDLRSESRLPGKISRHVVRAALEEPIEQLKQPRDIEEPPSDLFHPWCSFSLEISHYSCMIGWI